MPGEVVHHRALHGDGRGEQVMHARGRERGKQRQLDGESASAHKIKCKPTLQSCALNVHLTNGLLAIESDRIAYGRDNKGRSQGGDGADAADVE